MRALALPLLTLLFGACSSGESARPNVLLISVDTLRPDHLSCYGYGRETSPRIDRLASEGVQFENHISSSSWTLPAHAALFTSVNDTVHGCVEATGTALSPAFTTLAERFKEAGYATGGFYAGPYLHPAFGLGQGFDVYENCAAGAGVLDANPKDTWAMDQDVMRESHQGVTNTAVYDAAHGWLDGSTMEAPFFAFVHLWDVHFDFVPPAPYDTLFDPDYDGDVTGENFFFDPEINARMPDRDKEHLVALYDGEIRWTDSVVGDLLDDLEEWGVANETIVVLTSDHGTEFFEHGGKGHRTTLFDELIRIPLIVRYPGSLPAGRKVRDQTRITDVGPTLLELADLPGPTDAMGHSLVPLARGEALDFENAAISELYSVGREMRSVRSIDAKFLDDQAGNRFCWFDLAADPRELRRLGDIETGLGKGASRLYLRNVAQLEEAFRRRPGAPVAPDIPIGVSDQLDAFGYTGGEDEEEADGG